MRSSHSRIFFFSGDVPGLKSGDCAVSLTCSAKPFAPASCFVEAETRKLGPWVRRYSCLVCEQCIQSRRERRNTRTYQNQKSILALTNSFLDFAHRDQVVQEDCSMMVILLVAVEPWFISEYGFAELVIVGIGVVPDSSLATLVSDDLDDEVNDTRRQSVNILKCFR